MIGGYIRKSCHSDQHLAQITTFTGTDCGTVYVPAASTAGILSSHAKQDQLGDVSDAARMAGLLLSDD